MRGRIKEFLFIKLTLYLSLSLRNLIIIIIYEKLSRVFTVAGFRFEEK